jgi:hypothetical protein
MQNIIEINRIHPSQNEFAESIFDEDAVASSNPLLNEKPVNFEKFNAIYSIVSNMETYYKPYTMELSTEEKHGQKDTYYTVRQSSSSVEACTVFYNDINQWLLAHRVDDGDLDRTNDNLKSVDEAVALEKKVGGVLSVLEGAKSNTDLEKKHTTNDLGKKSTDNGKKRTSMFGGKGKELGTGSHSMDMLSAVPKKKMSVIGGSQLTPSLDTVAALAAPGVEPQQKKQNRFSMLRK